jgi:hypothetical protein
LGISSKANVPELRPLENSARNFQSPEFYAEREIEDAIKTDEK